MKRKLTALTALLLVPVMLLASCGKKTVNTDSTTGSDVTENSTVTSPDVTQNGLYADYFRDTAFTKYVKSGRVNSIDNVWENGEEPVSGIPSSNYSIRISGRIKTSQAGTYTFTTEADDGVIFYVDGKELINDAGPHFPETHSASVSLEAEKYYDIRIDYYNGDLGGTLKLYWESESINRQLIPSENLYMPEKAAEVSHSRKNGVQTVTAMMRSFTSDEYTLIVEKHNGDGKLIETLTKERNGSSYWSLKDEPGENSNVTYTAYITDKDGNKMSNVSTQKFGEDYAVVIDPAQKAGKVSNLLYGACMEDVNHELYGGIWSQMIFGESFEEQAVLSASSGFQTAGGKWYPESDGDSDVLCIDNTANGPKLIVSNSRSTTGYIEADVYVDGEAAGFIIKTSNASEGADNFDGYEISVLNNAIRLGKHLHNYVNISDTPCNAPQKTWIRLRAEFTENTMTVYVNGTQVVTYTDPSPINEGCVGFRSWNAATKYKNVKISVNGVEKELSFEPLKAGGSTAGMWEGSVGETTHGYTSVITEGTYTGKQAQRLEITSGSGSVLIDNKGLNRSGMCFLEDKDYNGYIYAKSSSPITVYVALENSDGTKRYAESSFTVEGDYKKYAFSLVSDTTENNGRFVIEIRDTGVVDVDYAFLEAGEWGLYKGLHVRADVGEMLEKQGITVLRFGGCMANAADYMWKKMTGEPENRGTYNGWWYTYSSYGFGIIEFMDLCEALEITYIPDFSSYETPEDMADFIKFAYGTDESDPWVQLRIKMGRVEPYNLKYIQIGNEDKVDIAFANRFNAIADVIWEMNSDVILIVGDFAYRNTIADPYNFTGCDSGITSLEGHKKILDNAAEHNRPVYFDIHFWSESGKDPYNYMQVSLSLYDALHNISPEAESALCVLELNANSHNFERALCNALAMKFAESHSDIIKIMCSANALQVQGHNDNGWNQGLLFMDNDSVWYQAPAYIDRMYFDAYLPYSADVECAQNVNTADFDVSATVSEDGKTVCVKILNRTGRDKGVTLSIPAFAQGDVTMKTVTYADNLSAVNTNAKPENTKPADAVLTEKALDNGSVLVTVSGYSVTVITLTLS